MSVRPGVREKRQHQRVDVRFEVVCVREGQPDIKALARDVSLGGMFIELTPVPVFGVSFDVVVEAMAARSLHLPVTVRWVTPEGCGVQFGLLGAYETHALVNYIKKHNP
jgi:PilZ domain-containing protein